VTAVGVVASLLVGAAFLLAGASKLAAGPRWPASARALGAPGFAIPLVPWVELAIGAALVTQLAVPWAAIAALALLVSFTVLIVTRLLAGERPACACFGQWSASQIGASHLVRNGVLGALAVAAMWA
jgi:uncharacterized membrane protein YphA (DoxX/SURF4 family)